MSIVLTVCCYNFLYNESLAVLYNSVKTETAVEDHKMILEACHCYPTSGHFGITKTEKNIGTLLLETIVQRCEGIGEGIQVF